VFVADTHNNRIQVFDGNGTFLDGWNTTVMGQGRFDQPFGIAVDSQGNVFVSNEGFRIEKFVCP
jgi:DNA-binding beta-propeller fold protein YncE